MTRKNYFISEGFEKATTWSVVVAVLGTQVNLLAIVVGLLGVLSSPEAKAGGLGTSTISAGSAPPSAATTVDSFQPDLFTGRATTGVPIAVPPGRKGVQPSIGLGYSSSSRNGWLGVGWSLDLGFIERSTRKGVPKYDSTDSFAFFLNNVSSELVRLLDGTYRAKDEGAFLKVENLGATGWLIRDKSGTRYLFGQSAASRLLSGTNTARWLLDKVIDVNGNTMTINYATVDGLSYLGSIDYTGHESLATPSANRVEFILEGRPDVESSFRTGYLVKTTRRLAAIEAKAMVGGSLQLSRRYEFSYRQSQRTGRSLLASVRQLGSDGNTTLPPVTFDYQDSPPPTFTKISNQRNSGSIGWNIRYASYDCGHDNYGCVHPYGGGPCGPANYNPPAGVVVPGGGTRSLGPAVAAVGNDGSLRVTGNLHDWQFHAWTAVFLQSARTVSLPRAGGWDVCCLWIEDASGVHGPFRDSINYAFSTGWSLIHLLAYNQNDNRTDGFGIGGDLAGQVDVMNPAVLTEPQLAGDVDGDGITDIVDFNSGTGDWSAYCAQFCALPPGAKWLSGFGGGSSLPLLGDWNGDGRTDIAIYNAGIWRFAASTGSNFLADSTPALTFGTGSPLTGDFNGDGVMDLGTFDQGAWQVATGTGSNFAASTSFNISLGTSARVQHLTGDFNGDGLTDIAVLETNLLTMAMSDGTQVQRQPPVSITGLPTNSVQSADFNGDGLSDLAFFDRAVGKVMVSYNTNGGFAPPVDLSPTLTFTQRSEQDQIQVADFNGDSLPDPAVFNATTGDSELAFSQGGSPDLLIGTANGVGGSTAITYRPASSLGNNFLPFLTPLVTETRSSDGLGNSYINTYSYTGGFYDSASKEFRGFGRVDVRDAEGNVATTFFNQDSVFKGRPSSSEFRDSLGRLFTRTSNTWDAVQPYPGTEAYFVRLLRSDSFNYDGTSTFKQTRSRMEYDAYGNVTTSYADGEVSINGDERSVVTSYSLNLTKWILNRPSLVESRDAAGEFVSLRRFCYDGAPDPSIAPTKGNLTKEEEWLDRDRNGPVGRWIPTRMTYDAFGNVKTVMDALNHSVTNTYDASGTFLVQVSNPLGHTRTMAYDPRFGHVVSSTDANNVTTTSECDPLGRIVKVIGPLDTSALPTTRYEYDLSSNPVRVTQYTRIQSGQAKELVAHTFTDGLGRAIQTRSPAESSARQVVTGTVEFDSKGRVVRQWTPYLDDASTHYRPHTLAAIAPLLAPPVVHTYDPLGRLLTTTDPDGTSTSIAYDHWTVTTADAKQQLQRRTSDAFGRLVQVQEFQGAGTNATLYATTAYQYDSRDNLVLLTDAVGNTATLQYDSLNRKIQMTDPDMGTWTYGYDDVGKLAAQTDARGVSILFTYDSLNRQTRKDYLVPPASGVPTNQPPVVYTYDNPLKAFSKGKLTEITDASGSSSFEYDTLGRLVTEGKTIDGTTYAIGRAYDLLGRLLTLTYPNNDVAAYGYNDQGGIETITLQSPGQPLQPIINSVDYNAAGQVTKMVYGNGVITDYAYNPQTLRLQNLKSVGPGGVLQDFTYNFDAVGNVQSIADAVHTASQSFTYDSLNRLVTANGARYGSFSYTYNQVGNMTGKEGVTQSYGALNNRPHAVTSTSSGLALTYDANGNLASKTGPGRLPQVFTFDAENRLVEVNSPVPSRRLDPGWNHVSFPQVAGEVPVASVITNFAGNCEQLTRFNASSNLFESFVNLSGTNQFDTVSAARGYAIYVTNAAGFNLPLGTTPAARSSQLLVPGKHLLPGPAETMSVSNWLAGLVGGVDYTDVHGLVPATTNLAAVTTVRPGQAYYVTILRSKTWTPPTASRIENPSTVRFVYDGDGGRVKKVTSSGITLFLSQAYEVSSTSQSTTYVFAGDQRVAARDSNGRLRIYHSDHLGSANVITDQSGASAEVVEYTPYGSISRLEGFVNVGHKFTGQRLDDEIALYFYNARYYDPEIGRFIQPDSIIPNLTAPQDLNRYTYGNNNPIVYVDPSGHFSFKKFGSSILQIVGVALAPFTGGASLWLSFGATAWSGVQAAQAGQFGSWAAGFAVSLALGGILPTANFANFGLQIGANALRGAAIGAVSGGLSSIAAGGTFGEGAGQGAIGGFGGGLVTGAFSSQQYKNLGTGHGFRSNLDVIKSLAKEGKYQEAIDYTIKVYGLEHAQGATYDASLQDGLAGVTDSTGKIRIGPEAFTKPESLGFGTINPSRLIGTLDHEGTHALLFRGLGSSHLSIFRGPAEMQAYSHGLRNAGKLNLSSDVKAYYRMRFNDYKQLPLDKSNSLDY